MEVENNILRGVLPAAHIISVYLNTVVASYSGVIVEMTTLQPLRCGQDNSLQFRFVNFFISQPMAGQAPQRIQCAHFFYELLPFIN